MAESSGDPRLQPGVPVVDTIGARVGVIRSVYPHYLAVEAEQGHPHAAYRVPYRAIAAVEAGAVRLSIPTSALDPMSPAEDAALGLPRHGGSPGEGDE